MFDKLLEYIPDYKKPVKKKKASKASAKPTKSGAVDKRSAQVRQVVSAKGVPKPSEKKTDFARTQIANKATPAKTHQQQNKSVRGSATSAKRGMQHYKDIDEVGVYESVLTGEDCEFEISPVKRNHIVALLLSSKGVKKVLVLETQENSVNWRLEIKQWLDKKGYAYNMGYTSEHVISQIYQRQKKEVIEVNRKEADRPQKAQDFYKLLERASELKASDIHIESREKTTTVRLRINGELISHDKWSVEYTRDFMNAVYNSDICEEKGSAVYNPKINQKAVINYRINADVNLRCRLQTIKAYSGAQESNDVILRLLPMGVQTDATPINELGYVGEQVEQIEKMSRETIGGIIVAGVTGSGKSTTLMNLLLARRDQTGGRKKIATIEDPAEYRIHGATQFSIARDASDETDKKDPFKAALEDLMRADPDIIMYGEIRSQDTAKAFEHGIESGHQVMSTVHASSGFEIVSRLSNLGIEDHVFQRKNFLNLMIYQRLLGTLCPHCMVPFSEGKNNLPKVLREQLEEVAGDDIENINLRGKGCSHCHNLGIGGLTVCAEVISPDDELRKLLTTKTLPDAHQFWREQHKGRTHKDIALLKMKKGIIDPKTIFDTIGNLVG